jgi:predicted glycoside hydrolase/deacetylase ChbG (UPF0249 family)
MSIRLIINADDYGHTPDVSRGIRAAHLHGIVTSTTCMMNSPAAAADIAIALKETPRLGLGVHLVLTSRAPLLPPEKVGTLVDGQGRFLSLDGLMRQISSVDAQEVAAEWRAQIEAFIAAAGRKPTHLDSHHHSSYFSPALFRELLKLAREYDCAIRLPQDETLKQDSDAEQNQALLAEFNPRRPGAFFVNFYDQGATRHTLLEIINSLAEGSYEIMSHPGYANGLAAISSYASQRENELDVLTDASVKAAIAARGIELISFAGL